MRAFDDVIYMMLSCKLCSEEFFVGVNPVSITIGVYWRMIVVKLVDISFLVNQSKLVGVKVEGFVEVDFKLIRFIGRISNYLIIVFLKIINSL